MAGPDRSCGLRRSSGAQHDVDVDGVEREDDQPILGLLQDAGFQQRMHIAVDGLHVAADPARRLANRHWPRARKRTGYGLGWYSGPVVSSATSTGRSS